MPGSSVRVAMTASGPIYQSMAAATARTYLLRATASAVTVQVPEGEPIDDALASVVARGVALHRFPWAAPAQKPHASLKITGWSAALDAGDGLVLLVDADTCCQRALGLPTHLIAAVRGGRIGAVADREPSWPEDKTDPWFVKHPRPQYVNSGVLLMGPGSRDVVDRCLARCAEPALMAGQYGDQRVLNTVLAMDAPGRLVALPADWNAIRWRRPEGATILHFAGAGGDPASASRQRSRHAKACESVKK